MTSAIRAIKADSYHGIPVLPLRVDDPIPTPRAPERYAVRVYPDLARYLLTFNHSENRSVKVRTVRKYAADMIEGLWRFTPEPLIFSSSCVLQNGQHRLTAVIEYGGEVWMVLDFGWPDSIITAIDRGAGRTNADALTIDAVPNAAILSGAMTVYARYRDAVGTSRNFSNAVVLSSQHVLAAYSEDPEGWQTACRVGRRVYMHLEKGLSPSVWAGAYRVIADAHPDEVGAFFDAIADGTDQPGSATRVIADRFRRRPITATHTGDRREPLEIIIRAFNAWRAGKPIAMPKVAGFTLSRVR